MLPCCMLPIALFVQLLGPRHDGWLSAFPYAEKSSNWHRQARCGLWHSRSQIPDTPCTMHHARPHLKVFSLFWKSGTGLLDIRPPSPSERFDDQSTQMDAAHGAEDHLKDLKMSTRRCPIRLPMAHGPWPMASRLITSSWLRAQSQLIVS